jgi:hypothetical protein
MIYEVSGKVEIRQSIPKSALRQKFIAALGSQPVRIHLLSDDAIAFKTPWLAPNWYLLSFASSGRIEFGSVDSHCQTLTYKVSLFRSRTSFLTWYLVILILFILRYISLEMFAINTIFILGSYGLGWLIFALRFRSFINRSVNHLRFNG